MCVHASVLTRSPEVALTPQSMVGALKQRGLGALRMTGLRARGLPLQRASMSGYVGTRGRGKIDWHM